MKEVVAKAEQGNASSDAELEFARTFLAQMLAGPEWCREIMDEYLAFLNDDLLGTLKRLLTLLEPQEGNL